MIGVVCSSSQRTAAAEFFELFKTPWEFYTPGRMYSVVISTQGWPADVRAQLVVLYGSNPSKEAILAVLPASVTGTYVDYHDVTLPVYGPVMTFISEGVPAAWLHDRTEAVAVEQKSEGAKVVSVGYDLFDEIDFLLSQGQPRRNALIPALDIHIEMLRQWIVGSGIALVEIPPVPAGSRFIACLTHDVDFVRIKDHKFGHTLLGFLGRATLGSFERWFRGEMSFRGLLRNLAAVVSLPAVHLGWANDFWLEDFDRILELERGMKPTFFFIPFKGRPGDKEHRPHWRRRAADYDVVEERSLVRGLMNAGSEVGVHGIDAWHDAAFGREEHRRVAETAGVSNLGVRMHWLCFDPASPRLLEEAGFHYDSTFGYNDAVGYRAGTAQAFRPPGVTNLLELPLHIQDTALLSNSRKTDAWRVCDAILRNASKHGGVLTLLWHTRSLAPERQWGGFYQRLLERLKGRVWFGSAGEVVEWFRKRRAFSFRDLTRNYKSETCETPGLLLRFHDPGKGTRDFDWSDCGKSYGENMHDHLQRVCL